MATQKAQFTFQFKDAQGVTSAMPSYVEFADTATLATAIADMITYGTHLDAASDAQIVACELKLIVTPDPSWKSAPVNPGANVEDTGLFSFTLAGLQKRSFSEDVPAYARSQVSGGKINTGVGSAGIQLITDWQTGVGIYSFYSEVFIALNNFRLCKLTTRKHRKSESVTSTEV